METYNSYMRPIGRRVIKNLRANKQINFVHHRMTIRVKKTKREINALINVQILLA